MFLSNKSLMPSPEEALPGRETPMKISGSHFVNGHLFNDDYPNGFEKVIFGLGCFWGAEKRFWEVKGVYLTAVGYAAGFTPNPTYEEVCSGMTGHNEVVLVIFNPSLVSISELLKTFWESHNPTQGMRQGNDLGTQYRSGIYIDPRYRKIANESMKVYSVSLQKKGFGAITTEIMDEPKFYFAEEYHQQYLAKNPSGYCGLGGTGVPFPETVNV